MRIHVTSVEAGEFFEGYIYDDELVGKYSEALEIDEDREYCDEIEVRGEYIVSREDGVPYIEVESITLFDNDKEIEVDLEDIGLTNLLKLEMEIYNKTDLEDYFTEDYEYDD